MVILDVLSAECPEHEEYPEVLPWKFKGLITCPPCGAWKRGTQQTSIALW